jgi:REP element-mobilizing transposase RayT
VKSKRHEQQSLELPTTRGGYRANAGRPPKGPRSSERHKTRPYLAARTPVHVTIRVARDVTSLRTRDMYRAIRWATLTAARHDDFRIIHTSIQRTHIHLVVEARDRMRLARGMQSFQISAARLINRAHRAHRRGTVFSDRYHAHILATPSEVRHAVGYVLNNWRRHDEHRRSALARTWKIDPFSSAIAFAEWRELDDSPVLYRPPPTYEPLVTWRPRTWLLRRAFHRRARPSVYDVPALRTALRPRGPARATRRALAARSS